MRCVQCVVWFGSQETCERLEELSVPEKKRMCVLKNREAHSGCTRKYLLVQAVALGHRKQLHEEQSWEVVEVAYATFVCNARPPQAASTPLHKQNMFRGRSQKHAPRCNKCKHHAQHEVESFVEAFALSGF